MTVDAFVKNCARRFAVEPEMIQLIEVSKRKDICDYSTLCVGVGVCMFLTFVGVDVGCHDLNMLMTLNRCLIARTVWRDLFWKQKTSSFRFWRFPSILSFSLFLSLSLNHISSIFH
jgi:hypothetical protein